MARDRRRLRRGIVIGIGVLAILVIAARIALTPIVEWRLRQSLANMKGMRGTFASLDLSVLRLSGRIHDLRIEKQSPEGRRTPFFQAAVLEIGLYWKELIHGHVVGATRLDRPKISLVTARHPLNEQKIEEAPQLGRKLAEVAPFRLDRFEVRNGEVLWIDAKVPERPELWLHGIEGTLENFASRAALAKGEPSVLAVSGTLQRSGKVSLFASADPLAKSLTFAGQARLDGLELRELGALLAATQDLTPEQGTLDLSVGFRCVDGHLTGGIRPIVKNASVMEAKPGLGARLKAFLADLAIDVLSDRVPGRNAVATTIPIHGEVQQPDADLWPTVLGVVRNAFVAGLANSLTNLPPGKGTPTSEGGGAASAPAQARRRPSTSRGGE